MGQYGVESLMETRFGFLQEPTALDWDGGFIRPLEGHDAVVQDLLADPRWCSGCFFPPLTSSSRLAPDGKAVPPMPTTFGLPPTHRISLNSITPDPASENFIIALFGMLKGLRLQREGWQHFHKCPTQRGSLCDFFADDREIVLTLDLATTFWMRNTESKTRKLAFGAIHWHLFAQLYEHEFERFNAQYIALDTCWKLAARVIGVTAKGHGERPRLLAEKLNLQTPSWAMPTNQRENACTLSDRRNSLVHEAMYADEPLGFTHPKTERGMELEMRGFVARCIFSLLGVSNEYTRSAVDSRQIVGFSFSPSDR